jgi:hypothetical protein
VRRPARLERYQHLTLVLLGYASRFAVNGHTVAKADIAAYLDVLDELRLRPQAPPPAARPSRRTEAAAARSRAASNLKTWLQGTDRDVSPEHLQVYLDEFVFRHNRRRMPMAAFQTLLGLGALHEPTTYREITPRRDRAAA